MLTRCTPTGELGTATMCLRFGLKALNTLRAVSKVAFVEVIS